MGVGDIRMEEEAGWQSPSLASVQRSCQECHLVPPIRGWLGVPQVEHPCEALLRTWRWGPQR